MKVRTVVVGTLAAVALACGAPEAGSAVGTGNGRLAIALTDAPNPAVQSIFVTVTQVTAHSDQGGWVTVFDGSQTIDLLSLKDRSLLLGEVSLPAGNVSQIRLVLADGPQYVVLADGSQAPLKTPSGQQSGLKLVGDFGVTACSTHTVTIDFDGEKSIAAHPAKGGSEWILRPVIRVKAESDAPSGCEADGGAGEDDAGTPVTPAPDAGSGGESDAGVILH